MTYFETPYGFEPTSNDTDPDEYVDEEVIEWDEDWWQAERDDAL